MIKNYPKIKFSKRFRETNNILLSLSFKKKNKSSHNKRLHFISSSIASLFHFQRVLFVFLFILISNSASRHGKKGKKKMKKKENKYSEKKIILILYTVLLSAPREIFSIIVSRNNPLTRKIRADDKAFLLSGSEKLPGVPSVFPR